MGFDKASVVGREMKGYGVWQNESGGAGDKRLWGLAK
jgi:hypothetical protein